LRNAVTGQPGLNSPIDNGEGEDGVESTGSSCFCGPVERKGPASEYVQLKILRRHATA
jgi:hypothetical protein